MKVSVLELRAIAGPADKRLVIWQDRTCPGHGNLLSVELPRWFLAGYVVDCFLQDDYERALAVTRTYRPFIIFWDGVMIAAMLGQLGRMEEAQPYAEAARQLQPDLADRAGELMQRSLKIDDLVDGLRRADLSG